MTEYNSDHIVQSCTRAGFSEETAETIERAVFKEAWDGITTRKLHALIYQEMKHHDASKALRYRLREAIADLNPNYHEFEKYITMLLRADGLEAEWSPRPMPQGERIKHEVDVVAQQANETFLVECKHHYHHHRYTGLDVPMRQWARLQDVRRGNEVGVKNAVDAERGWVVVNTKLSDQAKQYARCKNVRMTAWGYPEGESLNEMVERTKAYPVTLLRPPHHVRVELSKADILTAQQLIDMEEETRTNINIKDKVLDDLERTARQVIDQ